MTRVADDGSCFYRCVALALADGRDHVALRAEIARSPLLSQAEQIEAARPNAYAGDRELAAAAATLNVQLVRHEGVHQGTTVVPRLPIGAGGPVIHLLHLYNPEDAAGHFDLLQ